MQSRECLSTRRLTWKLAIDRVASKPQWPYLAMATPMPIPLPHERTLALMSLYILPSENTGLQIVCRKGNLEITKLLVESKAQLDGSDNRGTPLLASCRWGNLAVVRYLVRAGANVKVTDAKGNGA
eukprot:1143019-Amorphochlora_amoeboformis.AAC.1